MNLIGCLDTPSKGRYWLNNQLVSELDDDQLARISQQGNWLRVPDLQPAGPGHVADNVELPLIYNGTPAVERIARAKQSLTDVGWESRMNHKPNELSGGQRQRVAVARALVNHPPSFWPTSLPATSTRRPAQRSWRCLTRCTRPATPSSW